MQSSERILLVSHWMFNEKPCHVKLKKGERCNNNIELKMEFESRLVHRKLMYCN